MTDKKTLPAIQRRSDPARRRVLVADDERVLARALERVLTTAGFEVTVVHHGNAAVDAVVEAGFDVILTDVGMPGTTGIDLLRVIRAYDLDVPVILMTGNPDVNDAMAAVELGALQYLCKPFPLDKVVEVVQRASQLHKLATLKREVLTLQGRQMSEAGDLATLGMSLDRALSSMWMAYQPIVCVPTRRVRAYEALMRSIEPTLPHPGAVLDAAERLDRLDELGRRVRQLVAATIPQVPKDVLVFVNLHPRDMLDPELASDSAPLSAFSSRVVLEITERTALDHVKDIETRVEILRYMGFRVAIDDLGAGYAGLTSFATLEPEFVKLDMCLVRGIHTSEIQRKVVGSVVSLCQEMKKGIIAEGIEEAAERDQLLELGCDWMQGYLFAKPGKPFPEPTFA